MTSRPDLTFTWDGVAVPWIDDTDEWTAAELRQVEALAQGELQYLSKASIRALMIGVSVARATKARIAEVDARLTLKVIDAIRSELDAQDAEIRRREAERLAAVEVPDQGPARPPVEFTGTVVVPLTATDQPQPAHQAVQQSGGEVLSPTSAGSEPA